MFFYLSKIFWFFVTPSNVLTVVSLVGLALLFSRYRRLGRGLVAIGIVGFLIVGASPLARISMRVLEDRFAAVPSLDGEPVAGVIVLGGAIGMNRHQIKFTDAAARMTATIELARRLPDARIVFTGGSASLLAEEEYTEADAARALFTSVGMRTENVLYEDRSRNTRENALFTRGLVQPQPGERWLLVTSAYHMPRAVGCFEAVGFDVVPYPVDFHADGKPDDFYRPFRTFSEGLRLADLSTKEWVGLVAYRLMGYTPALLPGG